jgi:hypothetical protein
VHIQFGGFSVLIKFQVSIFTFVTWDKFQLGRLVGLTALTRLLIRQTEICTHVGCNAPTTLWTMKNIPTLLFILLVSCGRQGENVSGQSDTNVSTSLADNFDFTIKDGQIGNLKTGEQLTDVLEKLKHLNVVRDSVPACDFDCDEYSPLYVINDNDYQNLFVFEPGWDSTDNDKLFRIRTSNKRFTTDKGVRVGMTVKDLKAKYEIDGVDVGGETGIHVIVKGFKGSFGIESPRVNDWWKIDKQNLPDSLKIDEIIIL